MDVLPTLTSFARIDADDVPDLVLLGSQKLEVGKGLGGFRFEQPTGVPLPVEYLFGMHCGDLDSDGDGDVAFTAISSSWAVLALALNSGGFSFPEPQTIVDAKHMARIADLNSDGAPDLLALGSADTFLLWLGDGDGGFAATPITALDAPGHDFELADLNADGLLDLVFGAGYNPGPPATGLHVALGGGDGTTFGPPTDLTDDPIGELLVADLGADGVLDVIATSWLQPTKLSVWRGHGDGTFEQAVEHAAPSNLASLVASRLDDDELPDVAVTGPYGHVLLVFRGLGEAELAPPVAVDAGTIKPSDLVAADFNRDGRIDLATNDQFTGGHQSSSLSLFLNAGGPIPDAFAQSIPLPIPESAVRLLAADLNRDNVPDLIVSGGVLPFVLSGAGDGTFLQAVGYVTPNVYVATDAGDVDGDGFPELIIVGDGLMDVLHNLATPWWSLGGALAGEVAHPKLTGSGDPVPDQQVSVVATGLPAGTPGALFVGLDTAMQPLLGGTLVPAADATVLIRAGVPLVGRWPHGLDPGAAIYFQTWFPPSGGEPAVTATNALVTLSQ
jgi:hypothetical protein